jgi:hypothetical protein
MRKAMAAAAVGIGLLLMVAAGLLRWVLAPVVAVLPADTNTVRVYTGSAASLLNPLAVAAHQYGQLLLANVPIQLVHRVRVLATNGSSALVSDSRVVTTSGLTVANVDYRYAVNRRGLGRGSGFSGVLRQTGVTFNFPIRTGPHDYVGWVPDTRTTARLAYAGSTLRGGQQTFVFHARVAPTRLVDPQQLRVLPHTLTKAALVALAAHLSVPPAQLALLRAALPKLPANLPLGYTYQSEATYYVAPSSGIVVDLYEHDIRRMTLDLGSSHVPLVAVSDWTFHSTPATLAAAEKDARQKGAAIDAIYLSVPLAVLVVGLALVAAGILGLSLLRPRSSSSGPTVVRVP